jgi:hypothetical protein
LVGALATGGGRGQPDNVAATKTYLVAWHHYLAVTQNDQRPGEEAVRGLVSGVKHDCAGVLAGARSTSAVGELEEEISDVVLLTVERPTHTAVIKFARNVERVHWSNPKLTYYVHHSAEEEVAKAKVALPNVCADAKALAANDFRAASLGTKRFLRLYLAATHILTIEGQLSESSSPEQQILGMLRPYERADDKALVPRMPTKRERERGEEILVDAIFKPVAAIEHALGLKTA